MGRLIAINSTIEDNPLLIMNLYFPTKDDHKAQCEFLNTVKNLTDDYGSENVIIGGDPNSYLKIDKDKKGGHKEKPSKYSKQINSIIEEYALADLWRVRNSDTNAFNRRENSRYGTNHSRLDYCLISIGLTYLIKKVK